MIEKHRMPLFAIFKCGQALKDFGVDALLITHPDMPWHQIAGMRNVLAHEYLGVDPVMIWDTIQTQLNKLQQVLEEIMR